MIIVRELGWFKDNNVIYDNIQKIRINPEWYNQSGWLVDSTQAKLEMYNPIVMSKMFLLNDAKVMDTFDSEYMFWIDQVHAFCPLTHLSGYLVSLLLMR